MDYKNECDVNMGFKRMMFSDLAVFLYLCDGWTSSSQQGLVFAVKNGVDGNVDANIINYENAKI